MRLFQFFLLLSLAGLATAQPAMAQEAEEEHIETDRDSFTPATTTAGRGLTILEAGYSFIDNRGVPDTHSFPEFISRYGMTDWLEFRLGANYEVGGESSSVSGNGGGAGDLEFGEIESESKVVYGFKAAVTNQDDWMPRSAAIIQANTPTSGPETDTHLVATYVWGWTLDDVWNWDSAKWHASTVCARETKR